GLPCGGNLYWAVRAIDEMGNRGDLGSVVQGLYDCGGGMPVCGGPVEVSEPGGGSLAATLQASVAFPSPASRYATVEYAIPFARRGEELSVSVYDVFGRRIRTLIREPAKAGRFTAKWDLSTETRGRVAPGIYFLRIRLGEEGLSRGVAVIR